MSVAPFAVALAALLTAGMAVAQSQPAVIFDMGGKFDKSFNEAAYNGAERFKKESGIAYREFEVTNEAQREQALRNMARRGATINVFMLDDEPRLIDFMEEVGRRNGGRVFSPRSGRLGEYVVSDYLRARSGRRRAG